MRNQKAIKWLYEQIPALVEKGILSPQSAGQLKEYYGELDEKPNFSIAFIVAGVLGAVLIGGGIILIFAYNWENLSRTWRTIFSFLPLIFAQVVYGYVFFNKKDSSTWVEASSGFLMLMLAASIALISQTYHIAGSMESFLFIWMLLSIPLLYLMNSSLAAIFYLFGIASWAVNVYGSESVWYWGFLLAFLPHWVINTRESGIRGNLLSWAFIISFTIAYFGVIEFDIPGFSLLCSALIISNLYLKGELTFKSKSFINRPFQTYSIIVLFIMCMVLGYGWGNDVFSFSELMYGKKYQTWAGLINFGILILNVIAFVVMGIQYFKREQVKNYLILGFPFLVLFGMLLTQGFMENVAIVLANLYLFIFGLFYIYDGIGKQRMALVNVGMLFISALIIARFFDTDWSFIIKGIVFVLLGIGFLTVNVVLSRRLKEMAQTESRNAGDA